MRVPSKARDIADEEELQAKAKFALSVLYSVARAAYGPKAGVVWIENIYGDPLVSRDGVTNLDSVHLADPVANMVARGAIEASRQSDRNVGDGTTAVIILAWHLYKVARRLVAGGYNRMVVETMLNDLVGEVDGYIDAIKLDATPKLLRAVAKVSSGDEALGELLADAMEEVGPDGGITIEDDLGKAVHTEITKGFYWPKGYTSVQLINDTAALESRFNDVPILITEKRMATASDIAPILDKIVGAKISNLVIVGQLEAEALAVLATLRLQGLLTATPVDVPAFAGLRSLMLGDLALVTDGTVLLPGTDSHDFTINMLGAAERVVITSNSTSIIGREGNVGEVDQRITELQSQYDDTESPTDKEAIKSRIGRLRGAMAIIHVGGASEIEQREVKLRVQDAVRAVQAAHVGGVVPGGGVALALALSSNAQTSPAFKEALAAPFKDLAENAGLNAEELLSKLNPDKPWYGFDLRNAKYEDLGAHGVVDPANVIREVVRNSVSVVAKIIIGTAALTLNDREARRE